MIILNHHVIISRHQFKYYVPKQKIFNVFNHYGYISDTLRHYVNIYINGQKETTSRCVLPIGCMRTIFGVQINFEYTCPCPLIRTTWCVGIEQRFVELITV